MRLFLSSENFGKYADKLLELVGENKRVAYIGNAKDYYDKESRKAKVKEHRAQFESLGFKFVEYDLRDYFDKKMPKDALKDFGLVWCSGGNTFLLGAAIKKSGFWTILKKAVADDELVYGGSSAGSIIATPSLHGSEHGDEPELVKSIYASELVWEGFHFVPFYITPHYKSDWFGENAENMIKSFKENNREYVALKDGQVIIVDGDKTRVLR